MNRIRTLSSIIIIFHGVSVYGAASSSQPPLESFAKQSNALDAESVLMLPEKAHVPLEKAAINKALIGYCGLMLHGTLRSPSSYITNMAFNATGTLLAGISANGAYIWNIETGAIVDHKQRKEDNHLPGSNLIAFNPINNTVAISWPHGQNQLSIFGITTEETRSFNLEWPIKDLQYSPKGDTLLCVSNRGTAYQVDLSEEKLMTEFQGYVEGINTARFDPSGSYVVLAAESGNLHINDALSGTMLKTLAGHTDRIHVAKFNADGTRIISVAKNRIRIWDPKTGACLRTIEHVCTPTADINCDDQLVFGSAIRQEDRITRSLVIEAATAEKAQTLIPSSMGHHSPIAGGYCNSIEQLLFSPDGTQVAVAKYSPGIIELWSDYRDNIATLNSAETEWFYQAALAWIDKKAKVVDPNDQIYQELQEKCFLVQDERFKTLYSTEKRDATP